MNRFLRRWGLILGLFLFVVFVMSFFTLKKELPVNPSVSIDKATEKQNKVGLSVEQKEMLRKVSVPFIVNDGQYPEGVRYKILGEGVTSMGVGEEKIRGRGLGLGGREHLRMVYSFEVGGMTGVSL